MHFLQAQSRPKPAFVGIALRSLALLSSTKTAGHGHVNCFPHRSELYLSDFEGELCLP